MKFFGFFFKVDSHQQFFDGFGADTRFERTRSVLFFRFGLFRVGQNLLILKLSLTGIEYDVRRESENRFHVFGAHVEH